jgi:Reverse transcriptase (RNA-dependent DNA polymerase)
MIFDIKMDGKFTQKARYIADGSMTLDAPAYNTYASVVSRESVRIDFLYASLNDLGILACDVTNAYINAPCMEKIWLQGGAEFGSEEGMVFLICKALYGLKSSGFSWRTIMSQTIMSLGYQSSIADPDVYRQAATKANGKEYYERVPLGVRR